MRILISYMLLNQALLSLLTSKISNNDYYSRYPILKDRTDDFLNVLSSISNFIEDISNITFANSSVCFDEIFVDLCVNQTLFSNYFSYSGKAISDIGKEEECIKSNFTYNLLVYNIKPTSFNSFDDKEVLEFLNQSWFYTGICFPTNCTYLVDLFFNKKENTKFFNISLQKEDSYINSIIQTKIASIKMSTRVITLYILIGFAFFILLAQILGSITKAFYGSIKNINRTSNVRNSFENSDSGNESISEDTEFVIFGKYQNSILNDSSKSKLKDSCYSFLTHVNLISNFSHLISKKSKYYNNNGIELFSFIQTILMFFIIFNQNTRTVIEIPLKGYSNIEFYQSFQFSFVFISSFAVDCWITLDGMIMIYKLMWYIKKQVYEKGGILLFKDMFKFYILVLCKVAIVVFLFFFLHYFSDIFIHLITGSGGLYGYYEITIFKSKGLSNFYLHLIPFYPFIHYDEMYESFEAMPYIIIYVNEFYVFTFIMIVFYIGMKIKSKLFDFVISVLVFGNIILTFLSFQKDRLIEGEHLTFQAVINSYFNGKYIHLLFNNYYVGIIGGMVIFYFKDIISHNPVTVHYRSYLPYHYCHFINQFLYSLDPAIKTILLLLVIIIQIFISIIFSIGVSYHSSLKIEFTFLIKLLFYYKSIIFSTLFMMMIILITLNHSNEGVFKHIINVKFFRLTSRISTAFFCSFDTLIYTAYCLFKFQSKLSYENLLLMSIGLYLLNMVIAIAFTLTIELPSRILIKYMLNYKRKVIQEDLLPLII